MSRKDYEMIADVFRKKFEDQDLIFEERGVLLSVVEDLGKMFFHDNPRFDNRKFMDACTGGGE